jgi:hypothetical protein
MTGQSIVSIVTTALRAMALVSPDRSAIAARPQR